MKSLNNKQMKKLKKFKMNALYANRIKKKNKVNG